MMIMKYKLSNKLNRRLPIAGMEEEGNGNTPGSSWKMAPKRVSLGSVSDKDDAMAYMLGDENLDDPYLKTPIPSFKGFPLGSPPPLKKLSRWEPPTGACFAPIGTKRPLALIPEDQTCQDNMITPMRSFANLPRFVTTTTAVISPRDTPDSLRQEKATTVNPGEKFSLPASLYVPTTPEQEAASLLMALKNVEGPLVFTPPKRRVKAVTRYGDFQCDFDESSLDYEDPPKKKRRLSKPTKTVNCSVLKDPKKSNKRATISSTNSVTQVSEDEGPADPRLNSDQRGLRLAMPDDPKELNSLHCFVRSDLLEVFTINSDGNNAASARVGFRCVHCGNLPRKQKAGASMSIFFPKSLQDIYRSVCTWQRIHFKACKAIPDDLVQRYNYLKDTDRTRGKKQHWVSSAYRLGLRNVDDKRGGIVWAPEAQKESI